MNDIILTDEYQKFAKELGISENFMRVLLMRGITKDNARSFIHPSLDDMVSPFSINGMKEAADRLAHAIKNREKVLVFGDYDCDGIGAVSILTLYLRDKLDVKYFIPNRITDGYGMTVDALKGIISKRRPNLVITVDCGITSVEEVEYLKSEGIDVIVTDHHEPQDVLPDCIIVDPKVQKTGFYDFCGAGVALKLVEAMAGRAEMTKYLDIAAISTIADVVPLLGDNRVIAYYGLKQITSSPRKGIKALIGTDRLNSHDVMFHLAPKINAAGRISSAMKAVDIFLEDDIFVLRALADELDRDNQLRQSICENVVNEATAMLKGVDFNRMGIIILAGEKWEAGVLGIAAARLVEEFKFPTILFSKSNGILKGSARSIKAVNIFETLSEFSDLYVSFGGHAQAAGITIEEKNFDEFVAKMNEAVLKKCSADEFLPKFEYDMEIDRKDDILSFAKELQLLEPTGYGNPQPVFKMGGRDFNFEIIGLTKHVKSSLKNIDLIGFGKFAYCLGATRGDVDVNFNLGVNVFQNRQYAQGIIRTFKANTIEVGEQECRAGSIHHLEHEGTCNLPKLDDDGVKKLLEKPFGTLFVCFNRAEYEELVARNAEVKKLPVFVATSSVLNPLNTVMICPAEVFDYSFYENVVFAGRPFTDGYKKYVADGGANCYEYGDCSPISIKIPDERFRNVYRAMKKLSLDRARVSSMNKLYGMVANLTGLDAETIEIALRVLRYLGSVTIGERGVIDVSNAKIDLNKSAVYRNVKC